jgi:hypothetical protein
MTVAALAALVSTALLLGGMVFFAACVAPLIFRLLPEAQAGRFVRGFFPVYYLYLIGCAGAAAIAFLPFDRVAAGIMAAVAVAALWLRQGLMPRINALSDAAAGGDAGAAVGFRRAHQLSVLMNLLQMGAAGAVLAGFVL